MMSQAPLLVSAGKTKYSPTVGMRLKLTAEWSGRGSHAMQIGQGQRALRLVERRFFGVALEQLCDVALAGRDDGEVRGCGIVFEVGDRRLLDLERAAAALELLHPHRIFGALVDALRRPVELAVPVDRLVARAIGRRHDEIDGIDGRAFLRPEIEADVALVLQRCVEHALAGHHLAGADVLGRAVLHQLDLVAFLQEAACELEAGLASAEYRDLATAHCHSPS